MRGGGGNSFDRRIDVAQQRRLLCRRKRLDRYQTAQHSASGLFRLDWTRRPDHRIGGNFQGCVEAQNYIRFEPQLAAFIVRYERLHQPGLLREFNPGEAAFAPDARESLTGALVAREQRHELQFRSLRHEKGV